MNELKLIKGGLAVDNRGTLSFVNDFDFAGVKRFYIVENHQPKFIRAWHAHKLEGKYVMVVKGTAIIPCVKPTEHDWTVDDVCRCSPSHPGRIWNESEIKTFVMSEKQPAILYIPPMYANGAMTIESGTKIMYMSTSTIEESKNDDIRFSADYWSQCWTIIER